MIDPVIFSFEIGSTVFSLYWYGILVMFGVLIASLLTANEFKRWGEDPEFVWDSLLYILPAGVIGARLWYVLNVTLGGNLRFIQNPITIIDLRQGGLHFFGGLLFGAVAFYFYARIKGLNIWLALDAVAPGLLIGQALARPANLINQELYGPPTTLPWGINIDAAHRIPPWNNLNLFPEAITRFHPTFAYEMIWNFMAAGFLYFLSRKHDEKIKPGMIFGFWLILAGVGRNLIEFFRPDQPTFPGTNFSYSRLVAILMAIAGLFLILVIAGVIKIKSTLLFKTEYSNTESPSEKPASIGNGKEAENLPVSGESSEALTKEP